MLKLYIEIFNNQTTCLDKYPNLKEYFWQHIASYECRFHLYCVLNMFILVRYHLCFVWYVYFCVGLSIELL